MWPVRKGRGDTGAVPGLLCDLRQVILSPAFSLFLLVFACAGYLTRELSEASVVS